MALIVVELTARTASGAQSESPRPIYAPILRTERVGAGVIRIVYDLNAAPSTLVMVTLEASSDGGQTFAVHPRATTGDVGPNVTPGAGKAIERDSTKDIDELQLDRYVFRVLVSPAGAPNAGALTIVILQGANVVNDVREKTAVVPIIEVRDRNDLPVAGATVTFAIAGGRTAAFANGGPTLAVTTNATGRATATGLRATSSGAVQIDVQAAFQGQVATATIQQTNAAQSATASTSGSAAVGKTGGGFPRAAIFGMAGGAAVGGGGIAVAKGNSSTTPPTRTFIGTASGPITGFYGACTTANVWTFDLTLRLTVTSDGNVTGSAVAAQTEVNVSLSSNCSGQPGSSNQGPGIPLTQVTGTTSRIVFSGTATYATGTPGRNRTNEWSFTGNLASDVVSGTLEYTTTYCCSGGDGLFSAKFSVTLQAN